MYLDEDEGLGREIDGGWDRDDVLVFVSLAVQFSLHPVSTGLCNAD